MIFYFEALFSLIARYVPNAITTKAITKTIDIASLKNKKEKIAPANGAVA